MVITLKINDDNQIKIGSIWSHISYNDANTLLELCKNNKAIKRIETTGEGLMIYIHVSPEENVMYGY